MTRGEYAQCDRIQMAELAVTVLCFHAGDTWNGWSGGETGTSNVEQTHRVWLGSGM